MARKMKLDFTGVESFQRASEGVHICKIVSADEKTSQAGNDMITVAFEVIKGDDKGARVYENYPLIDTALWKLKGLLQAIGMKADGKVQIDLDKLIGRILSITVKHEEYEGKTRARVDSVSRFSAAVSDDDAEEAEEDIEEDEEEKPVKAEKAKVASKKAPMPEPVESDDDEDEDDWEEEEEEKPKKKASKPEAKPEKKAEKKPSKKSDDDEDDWDDSDWDEA